MVEEPICRNILATFSTEIMVFVKQQKRIWDEIMTIQYLDCIINKRIIVFYGSENTRFRTNVSDIKKNLVVNDNRISVAQQHQEFLSVFMAGYSHHQFIDISTKHFSMGVVDRQAEINLCIPYWEPWLVTRRA